MSWWPCYFVTRAFLALSWESLFCSGKFYFLIFKDPQNLISILAPCNFDTLRMMSDQTVLFACNCDKLPKEVWVCCHFFFLAGKLAVDFFFISFNNQWFQVSFYGVINKRDNKINKFCPSTSKPPCPRDGYVLIVLCECVPKSYSLADWYYWGVTPRIGIPVSWKWVNVTAERKWSLFYGLSAKSRRLSSLIHFWGAKVSIKEPLLE